MKKRIVSLVLALCVVSMCALFVACNSESTFSVVNAAMEKSRNLNSIAAEMKMDMNMSMEGMTLSIPLTADMKATGLKGDSPIVYSTIFMTMLGQSLDMEMYQEGDWAYMVLGDMKYKTNVASVESEYDYIDDMDDMLQDIPEELLKDVELVKNDDGSKTATVSIPDEQFADIYDDFIAGLNSTSGTEIGEAKISDAVVNITIADGYISVYDMEFVMTMDIEGMSTTMDVKATITYKDPGAEVTVTPPAGYEDFEELDLNA